MKFPEVPPACLVLSAVLFVIAIPLLHGAEHTDWTRTDWTGIQVPPYPEGMESILGACIASALGAERYCDYALGEVHPIDREPEVILVQKLLDRDEEGMARWIVTDWIEWPDLEEGMFLAFAMCRLHGVPDETILAVARVGDAEWLAASDWVRKVDLGTGKLVPMSAEGVECYNQEWDL